MTVTMALADAYGVRGHSAGGGSGFGDGSDGGDGGGREDGGSDSGGHGHLSCPFHDSNYNRGFSS